MTIPTPPNSGLNTEKNITDEASASAIGRRKMLGLLASGANKLALKQSAPSLRQILFWDRCMIPASKALDPLLGYRLGKSIAAVWVRSR